MSRRTCTTPSTSDSKPGAAGWRTVALLAAIVGLEVIGNGCLSRGMRQVGPISWPGFTLPTLMALAARVGTNGWVLVGVAALLGYFLCYLTALARLDLSYVLPMAASSYLLTSGFAWAVLGERIPVLRWAGTALIAAGLVLVQVSTLASRAPAPETAR